MKILNLRDCSIDYLLLLLLVLMSACDSESSTARNQMMTANLPQVSDMNLQDLDSRVAGNEVQMNMVIAGEMIEERAGEMAGELAGELAQE